MARINQLQNSTTLNATDVFAKDAASGGTTSKMTAQNLANNIKELADLVNTTEMNAAIAQSTATGGAGYFKSPDGTLIQWGVIEGAKNGDRISFTMAYAGNTPCVTITPYYNNATTIRCVLSATPTLSDFLLTAYDTSTGAVSTSTTLQCRWIAAGRWK